MLDTVCRQPTSYASVNGLGRQLDEARLLALEKYAMKVKLWLLHVAHVDNITFTNTIYILFMASTSVTSVFSANESRGVRTNRICSASTLFCKNVLSLWSEMLRDASFQALDDAVCEGLAVASLSCADDGHHGYSTQHIQLRVVCPPHAAFSDCLILVFAASCNSQVARTWQWVFRCIRWKDCSNCSRIKLWCKCSQVTILTII